MSVYLVIAPDRYDRLLSHGGVICDLRYRFEWQDYEAFEGITAEAVPLGSCPVAWNFDDGVRLCTSDSLGQPLKSLSAWALCKFLTKAPLEGFDKAMLAFLQALPAQTRIILWYD